MATRVSKKLVVDEKANDYRTIKVAPLNPVVGAEIEGVDLSRPLSDDQLAEIRIASLEHHPDRFKYSNLAKSLLEELKKQRETLVKKAGIMAKGKLELELSELKKLLANGLRIKFETTTKEKEFLEEQLRAGGQAEVVRKYKYSVAVADDQLYWPYEGEYWRDELGTYQYTLTKGCVEKNANRLQPQATRSGD